MIRHDRPAQMLAVALSALAGYVDAVGFITLGGFFVSFMSGNTTRLGVGLARSLPAAATAAALIATFVGGAMLGSLCGYFAGERRRPAVLALVAALLAVAALLGGAGRILPAGFAMTLAMGAANAVFERDGEVQIGVTYMTGTLVKFGQRLVGAMLGGDKLAWAPYLLLWLGLAAGAVCGAALLPFLGFASLWIAAAVALALAATARWT